MRVLGLIPARGGSKGIPNKNIRDLNGRPLLWYTAQAALEAQYLDRVVLSTEDSEIAKVGRACGLDVPFVRPSELSEDRSPTFPVIEHALNFFDAQDDSFDAVCLLQPVTPLRKSQVIDDCISLMKETDADSVITMLRVPIQFNPHFVYFVGRNGNLEYSLGGETQIIRRQDAPTAFVREGSVYLATVETIRHRKSLFGDKIKGLEIDPGVSVNIDSMDDWERAESILRRQDRENENTNR